MSENYPKTRAAIEEWTRVEQRIQDRIDSAIWDLGKLVKRWGNMITHLPLVMDAIPGEMRDEIDVTTGKIILAAEGISELTREIYAVREDARAKIEQAVEEEE